MKKEEDGLSGIDKLAKTLINSKKKISDTWQEAKQQITEVDNKVSLSCLQNGKVDFHLIEEDVKRIHQKLISDGLDVLGNYLLIEDKEDSLEIKTYIQKGEKTLLDTIKFKAESISNLPPDIYEKLQEDGKVELHLRIVPTNK